MPKTKQHDKILEEDREKALIKALLACKGKKELKAFLTDLCTPQELSAFAERWMIARLLSEGDISYREISALTGASTTTVGRVARFLQQEPHKGYTTVLSRISGKD
jgi:TrpR-related protein YerC/YecD